MPKYAIVRNSNLSVLGVADSIPRPQDYNVPFSTVVVPEELYGFSIYAYLDVGVLKLEKFPEEIPIEQPGEEPV